MSLFLSYSRHDLPFVKGIFTELQSKGAGPWLDLVDIPIGADWSEKISRAIEDSDAFILIASPWSINSKVALNEWIHAYKNNKPILLLVIQSIPDNLFRDAIGQMATPNFQREDIISDLHWIDLRAHPQEGVAKIQKWLDGSLQSEIGPLPAPPESKTLFADIIPEQARLAVNTQFYGGMVGIILLFFLMFATFYQLKIATNISFFYYLFSKQQTSILITGRGIGFLNLLLCMGLIFLFAFHHIFGAYLTYQRLSIKTIDRMQAISFFTFMACIVQAYIYNISVTAFKFPFVITIYLMVFLFILAFIFITSAIILKNSKVFLQWQPGYDGNPVLTPHKITRSLELTEARYPFPQIKSKGKIKQVCLVYAYQDAPFAQHLKKFLKKEKIPANEDLEVENPHSILICILSPFFIQDKRKMDLVRRGLSAGIPVQPVLLQDTIPPQEIANLNWIDAQEDFKLAIKQILDVIIGSPIRSQDPNNITIPERYTTGNMPIPERVFPFLMSLILLTFIMYFSVAIMPSFQNENFSLGGIILFLWKIFLVATFPFLLVVSSFRRISFNMVFSIIMILAVVSLPYQYRAWQTMAHTLKVPDIQTFIAFYLLVFGCILFSSARIWLPGGWYIKPGAVKPIFYILIGILILLAVYFPYLYQ